MAKKEIPYYIADKLKGQSEDDNPYDQLVLVPANIIGYAPFIPDTPIVFPGICKIDIDTTWNYTVAKTDYGKQRIKPNGLELRTLNCSIKIYNKQQFDIFVEIAGRLFKDPVKKLPPFEIQHPMAQIFNVSLVNILKIKSPAPNALDGWNVEMILQEYFYQRSGGKRDSRTTGEQDPIDKRKDNW